MSFDSSAFQAGPYDVATVLVTGASGFIGRALCNNLAAQPGVRVIGVVRFECRELDRRVLQLAVDLSDGDFPEDLLFGVSHVVHLAAEVHGRGDKDRFEDLNNRMTARLLNAICESSTITHFVYMSSISVFGPGGGSRNMPIDELTVPRPENAYGRGKLEGEALVGQVLEGRATKWTIIRPPLVYGADARGSFHYLLRLVRSGMPMPFGRLTNGRTMVSRTNLVSLVERCLWHPAARCQIFHACDSETLHVAELIRVIEQLLGRRHSRVLNCPRSLLRMLGAVTGRSAAIEQLMRPLWLSNRKAHDLLGWKPVQNVFDGLEDSFLYRSPSEPDRLG